MYRCDYERAGVCQFSPPFWDGDKWDEPHPPPERQANKYSQFVIPESPEHEPTEESARCMEPSPLSGHFRRPADLGVFNRPRKDGKKLLAEPGHVTWESHSNARPT